MSFGVGDSVKKKTEAGVSEEVLNVVGFIIIIVCIHLEYDVSLLSSLHPVCPNMENISRLCLVCVIAVISV